MRICIVAEGCYPYMVGGVSSWVHSMIRQFPDYKFIILAIVANRSFRGKFKYELPENVIEVYELYLDDCDWTGDYGKRYRRIKLNNQEYEALKSLLLNQNVDWETLVHLFNEKKFSLNDFLMGEDFFQAVLECYQIRYPEILFSDFLWTMRSMYLPLFHTLKMDLPEADLYHCVATGYAGVLGSMAKIKYGSKLLISEHGIYTREREEELIRAKWVEGVYKNIWIEQFRKMSMLAYERADLVTSLYAHARELQIELGCPAEKTVVTPNGIDETRFVNLTRPDFMSPDQIHIGAILRVTPIKDVKTMLRAFAYAKEKLPNLKLWIMGPTDEDEEYAKECFDMVELIGADDVEFTGRVNVADYMGGLDMTILTSISEGQPLTILESYAAHKPVIATDVGNCRGLIYGEDDDFGAAGILTHIMNVAEIADAMVRLGKSRQLREKMGEAGYKRLMRKYRVEDMRKTYSDIYWKFEDIDW
ncbi:MAG: GT4 family glycosyltransferase PelF [Lachnobacterium sp.]|nr:GT4 family glycosyltransferase PelF [Lachnobacterium sp.]